MLRKTTVPPLPLLAIASTIVLTQPVCTTRQALTELDADVAAAGDRLFGLCMLMLIKFVRRFPKAGRKLSDFLHQNAVTTRKLLCLNK